MDTGRITPASNDLKEIIVEAVSDQSQEQSNADIQAGCLKMLDYMVF